MPAEVPLAPAPSVPVLGKRAAAGLLGTTLKRANWGKGEGLDRMMVAISDWDAKSGAFLEAEKEMPLGRYAELVGIPYPTLVQYACKDIGKRKVLGLSVGNKAHFNGEKTQFAADVIRIRDRGNDGMNKRECVDMLHDLRPDLNRKAVMQAFDRTVRPQHTKVMTGIVHANPTTVKRTAITVAQQYRWHTVPPPPATTSLLVHVF